MLSKNAFNALLKTLEEPPPHVKFIFATTEIRKIPVTIISRCQKFDLKRVEMDELSRHLVNVAAKESITLPEDCATLIAAAAEGSVRDSLSLLDQAIAMHTDAHGNVAIGADSVRDMLGLADKSQLFTLLDALFTGDTAKALAQANQLHAQGADPAMLLADLLDITHYLTRILAAPILAQNLHFSPAEQERAKEMVGHVNVPALTRAWQILTRGADELRHASNAKATLEMVLVRLGYASQLPSPAELVRAVQSGAALPASPQTSPARVSAAPSAGVHALAPAVASSTLPATPTGSTLMHTGNAATATKPQLEVQPVIELEDYAQLVALFEQRREMMLATHLIGDLRLVSFASGRLELRPVTHIAPDVPARLQRRLNEWTGLRWQVLLNNDAEGEPTIREQRQAAAAKAREYALSHPKVRAVMEAFPDANVIEFIPNKKS